MWRSTSIRQCMRPRGQVVVVKRHLKVSILNKFCSLSRSLSFSLNLAHFIVFVCFGGSGDHDGDDGYYAFVWMWIRCVNSERIRIRVTAHRCLCVCVSVMVEFTNAIIEWNAFLHIEMPIIATVHTKSTATLFFCSYTYMHTAYVCLPRVLCILCTYIILG